MKIRAEIVLYSLENSEADWSDNFAMFLSEEEFISLDMDRNIRTFLDKLETLDAHN